MKAKKYPKRKENLTQDSKFRQSELLTSHQTDEL